ncbi:Protein kinase domain-containing protein [Psidium guajava]|nr:Protein kinase domain-containing protein [Psidium guajava]
MAGALSINLKFLSSMRYNKPLQASVRAVTDGTLWALKREDFRGILMSEFSNLSSLKLLRSVDLLSRLTILRLSHVADSLSEVSFSDGQRIFDMNEAPCGLYIVQKGLVKITFSPEMIKSPNIRSLKCDYVEAEDNQQGSKEISLEKNEGSYFGEWVLLGEEVGSVSGVAVGDVKCAILTKEKFDSVVGPLAKLSQDDEKERDHNPEFINETTENTHVSALDKVDLSRLEWKKCLYSTDCSEIGLVLLNESESLLSLKRFSKQKVKQLGKEEQALKEKNLMKIISPSACVPQVLCTFADRRQAGILLNTCLACPLASILYTPLDDTSAVFCAASIVNALEVLHEVVDFRFAKKLSGERTFTICGRTDYLAPEVVQGRGHGFPADWYITYIRSSNRCSIWPDNKKFCEDTSFDLVVFDFDCCLLFTAN